MKGSIDTPPILCYNVFIQIPPERKPIMKIGNCAGVTGDPLETLRHLKELGYDTADVQLADTKQPWYHDTAEMERLCASVRAAADEADIELFQMHGPWPTDDTTEESRVQAWDYFHRAVYACHLLGAKYMILHPQMPYGWGGQEDPDVAEALTVALLRDLLPDCAKYGVIVCLENMPFLKQRISTMDRIAAAVAQVDSPLVGICLDTGHVNVFEGHNLGDAVRIAAPYLRTVHVHDNDGKGDRHMLPYLGTCDWDSFTTALAEIGFDGSLSFETGGPVSWKMPEDIRAHAEQLTVMAAKYLAAEVESKRK